MRGGEKDITKTEIEILFYQRSKYTEILYSLERFLSICREKMSKGFLKFYKLIMKPETRSDHYLKSSNVNKLNSRINYTRLH